MIPRYSPKDMAALFSDEARFGAMLEVELLAAEALSALGIVPVADAQACRERAPHIDAAFVADVDAREAITNHDTAAFVDIVQDRIGSPEGTWIHYGLTSSDVVDTALCWQLTKAADLLIEASTAFVAVLVQIMLLDIVFSLDSVITAVGMVNNIPVMVGAVVVSVIFMMFFSGPISRFVEAHPTIKMLALSFLLLIGVTLIADGFGQHVSKGYIYFAMGFSVFVEMLNLKLIKKSQKPVHFHQPYSKDS